MKGVATILVVSASLELSEKIHKYLASDPTFSLLTADQPSAALELASRTPSDFCILDSQADYSMSVFIPQIRSFSTATRVILVLPGVDAPLQSQAGVSADGYLPFSFTALQLRSALARVSDEGSVFSASQQSSISSFIQRSHLNSGGSVQPGVANDASMDKASYYGRHLAGTISQTSAREIILIKRRQLLAQAGELPDRAVEELVDLINSFSHISLENLNKPVPPGQSRTGHGDLVRFLQLVSTQGSYLLYAITLNREILQAMLFDQNTSFSTVRRQTWQVAAQLRLPAFPPAGEGLISRPIVEESPAPERPVLLPAAAAFETAPSIDPATPQPAADLPASSSLTGAQFDPTQFSSARDEQLVSINLSNPAQLVDPGSLPASGYHDSSELDEASSGDLPASRLPSVRQTETTPSVTMAATHPALRFSPYITYSCMLVPRMPQHLLSGNLASFLFSTMGQLCLAFGWRLEHLSIHEHHVQWIAGAPITTSPAVIVRTLRQRSSHSIFSQFPRLAGENPSGDFWSPGFFISGGSQAIQPDLVDGYVKEIRHQQGVS